MKTKILAFSLLLTLLITSCAPATTATPTAETEPTSTSPPEPRTLTVMTHDSFAVSEGVLSAFESANNAEVKFIEAGDTGTAVNKAILSKDKPLADVFYGVDNTFLSRALEEDIFQPYDAPMLEVIPDEFKLDPQNRALPVDYGDVCLNYEIAYFEERG